jgi:hypothetical protein
MIYHYLLMMERQESNIAFVEKLVSRAYYASCFSLPLFANPPDDLEKDFVVAAKEMATTLIGFTKVELDHTVFEDSLRTCIERSNNDFVKGCCVGLLYLLNKFSLEDIETRINEYAQSEDAIKIKLGEFVRGVIFECQTKILFNDDIIRLLTDIIGNLEWNIFSAILPPMRKTFTQLTRREFGIFVEKIAELYGLKVSKIKELKGEVEDQYLVFFSEIDYKVRKIFEKWFGEV